MVIRDKMYTAEEFYALMAARDDDYLFELVDGQVEQLPLSTHNSYINARIGMYISQYDDEYDLVYVLGANCGYVLDEYNVFLPSCSFISHERFAANAVDLITVAPDLAIETILPNETAGSINEKTRLYLDTGAKVVWIIYPDDRIAEIRTTSDVGFHVETVDIDGVLTAADVLPDFELPMRKIFPKSNPASKA